MSTPADDVPSFTPTGDALLLASVGSEPERDLLNSWLDAQRRATPRSG